MLCAYGERFSSRPGEFRFGSDAKATEAAWIDKAQLASRGQRSDRVSVPGRLLLRRGDQHPSGHAKMDNPLFLRTSILGFRRLQVEDDVFSDTAHSSDTR